MRRTRAIIGYIGLIIIFSGLLIMGVRLAQQYSPKGQQPPVAVVSDQSEKPVPDTQPQHSHASSTSEPRPKKVAQELPKTGSADTFLSALGLGAMTASVLMYLQSRRLGATL